MKQATSRDVTKYRWSDIATEQLNPSNVVHSAIALEDTLDLDVFLHPGKTGSMEPINTSEANSPCAFRKLFSQQPV
jgi:hypothetical protein